MKLLLVLISCAALGCASATSARESTSNSATASGDSPAEMERVLRDYERGWRAHDAVALANLFTEDGFVLSNGRPPVRGREAIREAYAKAGGELELRALGYAPVGAEGDVGYIVGVYSRGPGAPASGKFVLALRRDANGRWLIAADMDNSID